jgi:hypothetical protein
MKSSMVRVEWPIVQIVLLLPCLILQSYEQRVADGPTTEQKGIFSTNNYWL